MAGKPLDPAKIAQKLVTRASAAGQDWADGIAGMTTNPAALAVAAKDKYVAGIQASIANNTWANRLSKITLADIQSAAAKAGPGAYTQGITNKTDKILAAFQRLIPKIQAVRDQVNAMPSTTPAQRDAKMLANSAGLRKIKGT
jgi:hypothetical protein